MEQEAQAADEAAEALRAALAGEEWRVADRNCREILSDTFFPSDGVGVSVAKAICKDCVVREPCLEYALNNRIDMVYGVGKANVNAAAYSKDDV